MSKLLLQCTGGNVFAIVGAAEADLFHRLIGSLDGGLKTGRTRGNSQHAPTSSEIRVVMLRRTRVKDLHPRSFFGLFQPADFLAYFESARVSSRGHHDAHRSIRRPAEVTVADPAVNRSFERLYQITLQAQQNWLRLRIAEATVELEHHGPSSRHHQSAVKDAFVLCAFGFHPSGNWTRNVLQQPVLHLGIYHRLGGIGSHTASVRARIAFAHPLVILRCG